MREVREIVYEAEDYENLKNMSKAETIKVLESIDRGWIGSSNYCGQDDYEGTQSDFYNYKMHVALGKAMEYLQSSLAVIADKMGKGENNGSMDSDN